MGIGESGIDDSEIGELGIGDLELLREREEGGGESECVAADVTVQVLILMITVFRSPLS